MAIKKSELYSSLWASCDELRGGMDAGQYKDYVLVLLFIKYISDKYAGKPYAPITIPPGAGFADMVALKGKTDIGDQINKTIIAPLEAANRIRLKADFNDSSLLGQGKEMVERLGNLIAIFENPALDFSRNRADGDDLLGDAYEYLMRHFATESGKSKGQFYTPAEVSRVLARIIGIASAATTPETTVYDPTCGSGSLLLKVAEAARVPPTLYGQEKDEATAGLAQMNRVLHNQPGALIEQGNTLADPKFLDGDALKTFDYVVANPPFSDKRWSTGFDPLNDRHGSFDAYGVYQQLMDYWAQTMQDDAYLIAADGWKAATYRVIETKKGKDGKPGKQTDKGWACDLLPKHLIVAHFFAAEQAAIDALAARLEATSAQLAELEEEHSGGGGGDDGEGGVFAGFDGKVTQNCFTRDTCCVF